MLVDFIMFGSEEDSWGGVILFKLDEMLYIFDEGYYVVVKVIDCGIVEVFMGVVVC